MGSIYETTTGTSSSKKNTLEINSHDPRIKHVELACDEPSTGWGRTPDGCCVQGSKTVHPSRLISPLLCKGGKSIRHSTSPLAMSRSSYENSNHHAILSPEICIPDLSRASQPYVLHSLWAVAPRGQSSGTGHRMHGLHSMWPSVVYH